MRSSFAVVISVIGVGLFWAGCGSETSSVSMDVTGSMDVVEVVGEAEAPLDEACIPDCAGKECGPDGCGGSCGQCEEGECGPDYLCVPWVCEPGSKSCQDAQVIVCGKDGSAWSDPVACAEGMTCEQGECVKIPICTPNEIVCQLNSKATCNGNGTEWAAVEPCPQVTSCDQGDCIPWSQDLCADLLDCMKSKECSEPDLTCDQSCLAAAPIGLRLYLKEIFWCIQTSCADWAPASDCFQEAAGGDCKHLFVGCTGSCVPQCVGKECGPDGCDGECGICKEGFACDPIGHCLCEPQCDGKDCGPNGCGAQCGVCPLDKECNEDGHCVWIQSDCGNGTCEPALDESCFSCPLDCGPCPKCGDGKCEAGELCEICPGDCGPCKTGDCCTPHDAAGCEDQAIVECVCKLEKDCCLDAWGNACVLLAKDCGKDC